MNVWGVQIALFLVIVIFMRAVVQRVKEAWVRVAGETVSRIGAGVLVLVGVSSDDSKKDALYLAEKIAHLRIFEDGEGKMNLSLKDVEGQALVVSQFTLYGDCRKGRRPSFAHAAPPDKARELYEEFSKRLSGCGIEVKTGVFQAMMDVGIVNHGPVTMLLDSKKGF